MTSVFWLRQLSRWQPHLMRCGAHGRTGWGRQAGTGQGRLFTQQTFTELLYQVLGKSSKANKTNRSVYLWTYKVYTYMQPGRILRRGKIHMKWSPVWCWVNATLRGWETGKVAELGSCRYPCWQPQYPAHKETRVAATDGR